VSPFDVVDFNKSCTREIYPQGLLGIPVFYYSCNACGFVFTNFFDTFAEEDWKHHVYNERYIDVDPDYALRRPAVNALEISSVLFGEKGIIGLDYGGGNGLTAELINNAGIDYDCFDPFGAKNISEKRFGNYNFCSAFEVFEHTPNPAVSLEEILKICSKDQLIILIAPE